ncbi:hypothetical protein ACQ4LE_009535 [Meloidogyne hapla]
MDRQTFVFFLNFREFCPQIKRFSKVNSFAGKFYSLSASTQQCLIAQKLERELFGVEVVIRAAPRAVGYVKLPEMFKDGRYKYMHEIWYKKQSDVMRYLLRICCWQYLHLTEIHRVPRPTRPEKVQRLG